MSVVDSAPEAPAAERPAVRHGRVRRRIGTVLIVLGVVALAYGAAIYFWRDPVTDLYARLKQHQLASQLEKQFAEYRGAAGLPASEPAGSPPEPVAGGVETDAAALEEATKRAAERLYGTLEQGQPLGRIVIPRLDIDPVFVNGTRWGADLTRGPGRYPETFLPGMGRTTAIAGHRTTFGAPFRRIDRLERGDEITLELPYGTFLFRVEGHEIVDDEDWSIIRPRGYDALVLSACHPLYSASQRWIVYARLVEVSLPDGVSYRPQNRAQTAAVAVGDRT